MELTDAIKSEKVDILKAIKKGQTSPQDVFVTASRINEPLTVKVVVTAYPDLLTTSFLDEAITDAATYNSYDSLALLDSMCTFTDAQNYHVLKMGLKYVDPRMVRLTIGRVKRFPKEPLRKIALRWHKSSAEVAELLIEALQTVWFPVNDAIVVGNLEVLKVFVKHGADLTEVYNDRTPYQEAVHHKQTEIVAYLASCGVVR